MTEADRGAARRTTIRRLIGVALILACLGLFWYAALSLLSPVRWAKAAVSFAEMLWDRLPHVSGLPQARKDVSAAIRRTEEAQTALREQAASANAALAQAAGARSQVAALKQELARSQAALAPLLRQQAALEAVNARHVERLRGLELALAKVRAEPTAPIQTRQEAVEALRRLGY